MPVQVLLLTSRSTGAVGKLGSFTALQDCYTEVHQNRVSSQCFSVKGLDEQSVSQNRGLADQRDKKGFGARKP